MPKSQVRPVQPKDLKIETKYEGLSLPLILDGEIQYNNLRHINLDINWLNQEIKKAGGERVEEVFLAELDTEGKLYVDFYNDKTGRKPLRF